MRPLAVPLLAGALALVLPSGAGAIDCGEENVTGEIFPDREVDVFSFSAAGTGVVSISIGLVSETRPTFVPCWDLVASDATVLAQDVCGIAEATLNEASPYEIRVRDDDGTGRGSYGLSYQGVSEDLTCGRLPCGPLGVDGAIDVVGDTDTFAFDGVAGDRISILLTRPSALPWDLFSPTGALLVSNPGNSASFVPFEPLPESGTYTVLVRHEGSPTTYRMVLCGNMVCGDSDGDGIEDGCDPCGSFSNTLPLNGGTDCETTAQDGDPIDPNADCNGDRIPNECQCGDFNLNGSIDLQDALFAFNCLPPPALPASICDPPVLAGIGDADNNGFVTLSDAIRIFNAQPGGAFEPFMLNCPARPGDSSPLGGLPPP